MQPLHIIFENSWQSGEVPTKRKWENVAPVLKREIRKTEELQARQSHISACQGHGTDPMTMKLY